MGGCEWDFIALFGGSADNSYPAMLLNSWFTRLLITRAARAYGFLDPIRLLARMRGFAQPSQVAEPIELLRAGMLFHARGLVNTKAIQNNLDWVWPYWVERQFNPGDPSFIPRAFSFSHINLTHRNWTAVGLPDIPYYPIVDPRGLVTPLFDGWSLDFWLIPESGAERMLPSKLTDYAQSLFLDGTLGVLSTGVSGEGALTSEVGLQLEDGRPFCNIELRPSEKATGHVAVSLRPYNPEGISFVERIEILTGGTGWKVNRRHTVDFDRPPARHVLSVYAEHDAAQRLHEPAQKNTEVMCHVGMATAVALFPVASLRSQPLTIRVPIYDDIDARKRPKFAQPPSWREARASLAKLRVGDPVVQRLYDLAITNIVLHSPGEVYPGPYTYKRFWFRDAAFILHALLTLGGIERTRRSLGEFAPRQRRDGYFLSQEGEWDSNGEALWIYHRFALLTGETLPMGWLDAVTRGARWIFGHRLPEDSGQPEAGLFPAGFSAEHLGPNDFYYWDDFWGVAGLRSAAALLRERDEKFAGECEREAAKFLAAIERSIPNGPGRRFPGSIPAAPRRRMDSGAIGSIVADYPLQLFGPGDTRVLRTADFLRDHSFFEGAFFQNMIHSGINAYLTLHLAQVRLRAGEVAAAWALMDRVAALASPTGQWPEAIHPHTGGGCMGDGQHIWAAAEWALMVRNCFVREEGEWLIIASGVREPWWREGGASFGPTLTPFGPVSVRMVISGGTVRVTIEGRWRGPAPRVEVRLPGFVRQQRTTVAPMEDFTLVAL